MKVQPLAIKNTIDKKLHTKILYSNIPTNVPVIYPSQQKEKAATIDKFLPEDRRVFRTDAVKKKKGSMFVSELWGDQLLKKGMKYSGADKLFVVIRKAEKEELQEKLARLENMYNARNLKTHRTETGSIFDRFKTGGLNTLYSKNEEVQDKLECENEALNELKLEKRTTDTNSLSQVTRVSTQTVSSRSKTSINIDEIVKPSPSSESPKQSFSRTYSRQSTRTQSLVNRVNTPSFISTLKDLENEENEGKKTTVGTIKTINNFDKQKSLVSQKLIVLTPSSQSTLEIVNNPSLLRLDRRNEQLSHREKLLINKELHSTKAGKQKVTFCLRRKSVCSRNL